MNKCFCGETIPKNARLCRDHLTEFGIDPKEWPTWLAYWIKDTQREKNDERNDPVKLYYDPVEERIVKAKRESLLDRFDEDGLLILRT